MVDGGGVVSGAVFASEADAGRITSSSSDGAALWGCSGLVDEVRFEQPFMIPAAEATVRHTTDDARIANRDMYSS
jgi:hypothetical protein